MMPRDPGLVELAAAAISARELAYAPYSQFAVGAALRTADGTIFRGGNVENAAYPLVMCAERVALYAAFSAGQRTITGIAVVTDTSDVASPCGGCRQVLYELAGPDCPIMLLNLQGAQRLTTVGALLPHGFGARQLDEARHDEP